jgi:hypothetical protein
LHIKFSEDSQSQTETHQKGFENKYNFVNSCIYTYVNYVICFNVLKHLEHNKSPVYLKHVFVFYQQDKTQSCLLLNKLQRKSCIYETCHEVILVHFETVLHNV